MHDEVRIPIKMGQKFPHHIYSDGEVEYRNAICELIASNVIDVKSTEDRLWIEFELGSVLFLMVDDSEVIYFTDSKKEWSYYPVREQ